MPGSAEAQVGEEGGRRRRRRAPRSPARSSRRPARPASRRGRGTVRGRARWPPAPDRPQRGVGLVQVHHQQQRLGREEAEPAQPAPVLRRERAARAAACAFSSAVLQRQHDLALRFEVGRAHLLQVPLDAFEPALGDAEVGEDQLVLHRLGVGRRVDRRAHGGDGLVAKRAHDVHERVGVAERRHVEQCLGRCVPGARQVGELDRGRHPPRGDEQSREPVEPRVGHPRHADRRLDLPVTAAPGGVVVARHQVEEGGLAGRRESNQRSAQHVRRLILTRHSRHWLVRAADTGQVRCPRFRPEGENIA